MKLLDLMLLRIKVPSLKCQLIIFASFCQLSSTLENLALRKNAWQPTNYQGHTGPSTAVDGNRNQSLSSGSCAMMGKTKYATWTVDLGKIMSIDRIDIYFRYDSPNFWEKVAKGRVAGFFLYISNTIHKEDGHLCFHEIRNATNSVTPNMTIQCIQHGQYIIYYNERKQGVTYPSYYGDYLYNELCEVEVYGCENEGFYGNHCNKTCPANCKNMYCDIKNGTCLSCNDGYNGHFCEQHNLALNKPAWQPSNYRPHDWLASAAVDGNRNQYAPDGSCALQAASRYATWHVNLGKIMRIDHIDIYFRNDSKILWESTFRKRVAGFFLYISNTTQKEDGHLCFHKIQNFTHPVTPNMTIQCTLDGQYVIYYNERKPDEKYPNGYYIHSIYNELCEVEVYGCENPGFYGYFCNISCPSNCKNMYCDIRNGACLSCIDGFEGERCEHACTDFFYGPQCNFTCGNCLRSNKCNNVDGTCPGKCAAGWRGAKCHDECTSGTYGEDCVMNCSANCANKTDLWCDNASGKCTSGCLDGWQGNLCNNPCDSMFFGPACIQKCGNCYEQRTCDKVNGFCRNGCAAGSKGDKCDSECEERYYGPNCKFKCSSQCANGTCNAKTGDCNMITDYSPTDYGPLIGGVVGTVVILILLAVVAIFFFRRFHKKKGPEDYSEDREDISKDTKSFTNLYVNFAPDNNETSGSKYEVKHVEVDVDVDVPEVEEIIYANNPVKEEIFPDVSVDQLEEVINEKRRNGDEKFKQEYACLPFGERFPCSVGKMEHNVTKNRFKTTFPYDHSRVKLESIGNDHTDYINANYIDGINREKSYIATQGPKQGSIKDFWRMIWQENVTQIVMLTNLKEGIKDKCVQYWPDVGRNLSAGMFTITTSVEKEYAFFVLRKLTIKRNQTKKGRSVTQYHYIAWPDHGIPDTLCLVIFHQYVIRSENKTGTSPVVVHCSAGIGRTGTYIALDTLYKSGQRTHTVNIPEYIKTMRKDRMNMVQTYEQYIAIFLTLHEAFKAPTKVIAVAELAAFFEKMTKDTPANQNVLRKELQTLLKIQPRYGDSDFKLSEQNSGLSNRTSILPLDRYSLHLMTSVPNRGTYINAITVPSFTKPKQFTIVPYPERDSVVDLLRLLFDHGSKTIVLLDPVSVIKSSAFWIPNESTMKTVEPFTVTFRSSENNDNIETLVIDLIHTKGQNSAMQVSILAPKSNIGICVDSDTGPIRELVTTLLNIDAKGLVTVMSRNGASMCGLFCAVFNVVQQLRLDEEVDIFTVVRQVQVRRPELCSSLDEYQTCYKATVDHILYTSDHVYSNN